MFSRLLVRHPQSKSPGHLQLFKRLIILPFAAEALIVATFASSQTPETSREPQVVIWRSIRNDFHNADIPTTFIGHVVEKTPSTKLTVGPGETISGKLQKSFNISSTWTPKIYQRMLSRIAELNTLTDVNKVAQGTALLVPNIPTVGRKQSTKPTSRLGPNVKTALTWADNAALDMSLSNPSTAVVAPQEEIQYFSVPLSEASKYYLPGYDIQGASGPLKVYLSQEGTGNSATGVLTDSESNLIKAKLLATRSGPKPVVVIVDDSTPDNQEYAASKLFIISLSKTIRDTYMLGDSPYIPEIEAFGDTMLSENPDNLFPNLKTHSSLIKQSLVEFMALDIGKKVTVVYIPLGATQIGVAPLLKELVYLSQLLKSIRPTLPPRITASQRDREKAKEVTEAILKVNSATFQQGILMPLNGGELTVTTDSLLLEAIGITLSYYADAARRPYWLSFSWTAPKFIFPTYFDAATYGMKFAAAGNHNSSSEGTDFLQLGLEYASRAATSQDFVVVMNSTGITTGCPSNLFSDEGLNVASISFPGNATDRYCGTSFSTPRVAWLAAAREAAFGQILASPITPNEKLAWVCAQRAAILAIKQAEQSNILGRYRMDIQHYFAQ